MVSGGGCLLIAVTLLTWIPRVTIGNYVEEYPDHFTNDFVVKIDGDSVVADLVASSHGFRNIEQLHGLGDNLFHFIHDETEHRSKRSADNVLEQLNHDPNVIFVEQQKILIREKRGVIEHQRNMVYDKQTELARPEVDQDLIIERYFGSSAKRSENPCKGTEYEKDLMDFNDQFYCLQWYLKNNGQTKGKRGYDINVQDAWKRYTGQGVVVTVLDDGLAHDHPEIRDNYDPEASYDLNDLEDPDHDPQPPTDSSTTAHGTRCAGEIAGVANNGICGVGVAYNANIGGVRLLDGGVTDKLEAQALSFKRDYVDIYSSSWGPRDDGRTMETANTLTAEALKLGAEKGRGGKGNLFAWATGNGGAKDDCNADGYVSSIYTLSIGCINDKGLSTYFSEICPSTMAVIFTGGSHEPPGKQGYDKPDISIITADVGSSSNGAPNCDLDFEGTSSAAPLLAGCLALVLEANSELTWRDVQHLVVETARVPNPEEDGWLYNGAGYHVNHKFGFGAIDCGAMVAMGPIWNRVNEQRVCNIETNSPQLDIGGGSRGEQSFTVTSQMCSIERMEHTRVHVKFSTTYRGDMSFHLVSPSRTDSEVLSTRPYDSFEGDFEWTFMTTHNWNEQPIGRWTLYVEDQGAESRKEDNHFVIKEWSLEIYGTDGANPNEGLVRANKTMRSSSKEVDKACELPTSSLNEVMAKERQDYKMLTDAVERGEPFSREVVEKLAEQVLDKKDYDMLEKFIQDELNRAEANDAMAAKSDVGASENYRENVPPERRWYSPGSRQRSNSYSYVPDKKESTVYSDTKNMQDNMLSRQQKYLRPENRELVDERDGGSREDVSDDDVQEAMRLLEEIISELDQ